MAAIAMLSDSDIVLDSDMLRDAAVSLFESKVYFESTSESATEFEISGISKSAPALYTSVKAETESSEVYFSEEGAVKVLG